MKELINDWKKLNPKDRIYSAILFLLALDGLIYVITDLFWFMTSGPFLAVG